MPKLPVFVAAAAMSVGSILSVHAMPSAVPALDSAMSPPLIRVADGCGPGRFRGVGGYCQGHRPITVRKVCTARRYAGALIRRCHLVRF